MEKNQSHPEDQALDLESIIREFSDLSDEGLPDPQLPPDMLPHPAEPEQAQESVQEAASPAPQEEEPCEAQEEEPCEDQEEISARQTPLPEDAAPSAEPPDDEIGAFVAAQMESAPQADQPEQQDGESFDVTGDTIRLDLSHMPAGVYDGAAPVFDDAPAFEEEEVPHATQDDSDFNEQWEPEYEQPMGEYIPPQPIQFEPHSRLRELKKKLVAGPEQKYYQLTEKGTGKLNILLLLAGILSLIGLVISGLFAFGLIPEDRTQLMIFGQLLIMFFAALLGSFQLIEGAADMVRGRFSLNTLLIFSFLFCCADGAFCLYSKSRVPCCTAFTLQVCMSLTDTLYCRRTQISQMDTLRRANNLTALRTGSERINGQRVILRQDGQVEDFMEHYHLRSLPDVIRSWYAVGALAAAVAVGITGTVMHGFEIGIHVAAVTLLAAVPASFFICLSRPADILSRRLHRLGTLICGWEGVAGSVGHLLFPLVHKDLFPHGTVKMNGVKFFGSRDPDEIVAYGTSLISADGGGLAPLFEQVLESRNCHHLTAENLRYYPGGIGGEVRGEPVLVGNLRFLEDMGVEIPEGLRVSQAVCVAVDGVLCGLFAINYEKNLNTVNGLHTLNADRGIHTALADGDFLVSPGFVRSRFGIKSKRMQTLDYEQRMSLSQLTPSEEAPALVLSTQKNLSALAYGLTGARALFTASYLGLAVHMAGGAIGVAIMLTLTILGRTDLLSPLNILLYQLLWSVPGILLTEWTRLI